MFLIKFCIYAFVCSMLYNIIEEWIPVFTIFQMVIIKMFFIRDRPFNLKGGGYVFLFRSEIVFQTTQELEYLYILLCKALIFFPEFNIRLYDKNSESDYFFLPPPKSEYFFQQHWESEYFFLEKKHNPPIQVKWSFP